MSAAIIKAFRKTRQPYTEEFRIHAVEKLRTRGSRTIKSVAEELGVEISVLAYWANRLGGTQKTPPTEGSLEALQKENAKLKLEKAILKKALAIYVQGDE